MLIINLIVRISNILYNYKGFFTKVKNINRIFSANFIMDLRKYNTPKGYSLIAGGVLFALGLFGFAFRDSFNVPDHYLVGSLILGFWW
jgi:hypothetical protein